MNVVRMKEKHGCNDVEITNVVASFSVAVELNIDRLVGQLRGRVSFEYGRARFPRITIYMHDIMPWSMVFIFASGSCVLINAKTPELARARAWQLTALLQSVGVDAYMRNFRVYNIASCFPYGETIDVNKLSQSVDNAQYMRERFPGATRRRGDAYATKSAHVAQTYYASGRVLLTGARSRQEIAEAAVRADAACARACGYTASAQDAARPTRETHRMLEQLSTRERIHERRAAGDEDGAQELADAAALQRLRDAYASSAPQLQHQPQT